MIKKGLLLLLFVTIISCDNRELTLNSSFPFEIKAKIENEKDNLYYNHKYTVIVNLDNDHQVDDQIFNLYATITKKADFNFKNEEYEKSSLKIKENTFIIEKGETVFTFIPKETGTYELVLSSDNGFEHDATTSLSFNVNNKGYLALIKAEKESIIQKKSTNITYKVVVDAPENISYKWKYSIEDPNIFLKVHKDSIEIEKNTYFDTDYNQEYSFVFDPEIETGVFNIKFTFLDNQGIEVTESIEIDVLRNDFKLSLNTLNSVISYNENGTFIGKIEQDFENDDVVYKGQYFLDGGNGYIIYNGKKIMPGDEFDLKVGDISFIYTPTSYEFPNVIVNLNVWDNQENEHKIATVINIKPIEFTFTASENTDDNNVLTHQISNILNVGSSSSRVNYKMSFDVISGSGGKLEYNGVKYSEGEEFPVPTGNFLTKFVPADGSVGIQELQISVKDNTGQIKQSAFNLEMYQLPVVYHRPTYVRFSCGGFWGGDCDYEIRLFTCETGGCSEAFNGATINEIVIEVTNRLTGLTEKITLDNNLDVVIVTPGDVRYFVLQNAGDYHKIKYNGQPYTVWVVDSNGISSEKIQGKFPPGYE